MLVVGIRHHGHEGWVIFFFFFFFCEKCNTLLSEFVFSLCLLLYYNFLGLFKDVALLFKEFSQCQSILTHHLNQRRLKSPTLLKDAKWIGQRPNARNDNRIQSFVDVLVLGFSTVSRRLEIHSDVFLSFLHLDTRKVN